MTKTTEAKWRALIATQERSGTSVRAFAQARDIAPATMYWWRARLRRRSGPTDLVAVDVVEQDAITSRCRDGVDFELQLDGSTTLRVRAGFDEGDLRRLIRALRC